MYSPCKRSLLIDMEFSLSKCLASSHPVTSDKMLSLYTTHNGLLFAVWKVCYFYLRFVVPLSYVSARLSYRWHLLFVCLSVCHNLVRCKDKYSYHHISRSTEML